MLAVGITIYYIMNFIKIIIRNFGDVVVTRNSPINNTFNMLSKVISLQI